MATTLLERNKLKLILGNTPEGDQLAAKLCQALDTYEQVLAAKEGLFEVLGFTPAQTQIVRTLAQAIVQTNANAGPNITNSTGVAIGQGASVIVTTVRRG